MSLGNNGTSSLTKAVSYTHRKTLLELHAYVRARGVRFDLALIGVYPNEYACELRLRLQDMIEACAGGEETVHLLHAYALSEADCATLETLCLICVDTKKSLDRQFLTPAAREMPTPTFTPRREARGAFAPEEEKLQFPKMCIRDRGGTAPGPAACSLDGKP